MKILGPPLFSFVSAVIFVIFLFKYWKLLKSFPRKFRLLLFTLRTITIIVLLFLLINPWMSFKQKEQFPQQVDVIFDLSESMKVHFDNSSILPENLKIKIDTWCNRNGVDVDYYRLGNKITSLTKMDASDMRTDFTNLPDFMAYRRPDQVLLITDG